jgi:hypothetical protein
MEKPKRSSTTTKVNERQVRLNFAFANDSWRIDGNDPFGFVAMYATISFIMKRPHHNDQPMEVTFDHVRFFFHVVSYILCITLIIVSKYDFQHELLIHILFFTT